MAGQPTFHWPLEFPEVMLDRGGFDAFVCNPPFMGGQKITGNLGIDYRDYLVEQIARSLSGYLHPSHIHGRSICTGCLDSATMLVRPNSSGLMHHGGARICMVVVRTTAPGTPSSAARSRLRREMRCPKTTWCSSCWISSRRSISRPSTSITPKSCAANRLST